MRDSADSYDPAFGRVRKTNAKRQRNRLDDEETFAKRDRHVRRVRGDHICSDPHPAILSNQAVEFAQPPLSQRPMTPTAGPAVGNSA